MTAYFDDIQTALLDVPEGVFLPSWFTPIEQNLVRDVSIASELPHFPKGFRKKANKLILQWGVTTLPDNLEFDYDRDEQAIARIRRLASELHSLFHEIARSMESQGFQRNMDNPLAFLALLADKSEYRRLLMAKEEKP
jgi:hypothetical protein